MRRLVVTTLLLGLASTALPAQAVDSDRGQATWTGLDVPYVQVDTPRDYRKVKLRFHATRVRYGDVFEDGIFSMAATADSAIAMEWQYGGEGKDIEGPLYEVAADGTVGTVDKRASGIPLADPLGHVAFWTKREKKGGRLIGYDTSTHTKVRGPLLHRGARVFAVEGNTAYVEDFFSDTGPVGALRWTPGEAEATPVPLPPADDPEDTRLIIDVNEGRVLSTAFDDETAVWSDAEGNVLGPAFASYGALSPDGRFLAFTTERRVKVIDVETGVFVTVKLSKKTYTFDYRWTPDGRIVLTGRRGNVWGDYDDAEPARRYVCTVPDGSCSRLPGRSALFYEPMVESSSWGQLLTLLIPIGSRLQALPSKALHAYLRQR